MALLQLLAVLVPLCAPCLAGPGPVVNTKYGQVSRSPPRSASVYLAERPLGSREVQRHGESVHLGTLRHSSGRCAQRERPAVRCEWGLLMALCAWISFAENLMDKFTRQLPLSLCKTSSLSQASQAMVRGDQHGRRPAGLPAGEPGIEVSSSGRLWAVPVQLC